MAYIKAFVIKAKSIIKTAFKKRGFLCGYKPLLPARVSRRCFHFVHNSDDGSDDSSNSGSGDDSLDNSTDDSGIVWDDNGDWSEE